MTIYTARARRDDGWWTVSVDEVAGLAAKVRQLEQVPAVVRNSLVDFPDQTVHPEDAVVMVFPEDDSEALLHVRELNERAIRLQHETILAMRQAARELCAQGLTFRDIGEILGVDFKRAKQLAMD